MIKDRLAVAERPGGHGENHRRVRRQEEIIWIREQGFTRVVSLLTSPHNLHNYDELGVAWLHRPLSLVDGTRETVAEFFPELRGMLAAGERLLVHRAELGDAVVGLLAGYLVWSGMVPEGPRAISIMEQITGRQLGPPGRQLVAIGLSLGSGASTAPRG